MEGTLPSRSYPRGPKVCTTQQDAALVNHWRNNPFATTKDARSASNFFGSRVTSGRGIKYPALEYGSAVTKPFFLTICQRNFSSQDISCNQTYQSGQNFYSL